MSYSQIHQRLCESVQLRNNDNMTTVTNSDVIVLSDINQSVMEQKSRDEAMSQVVLQ